MMLWHHCFLAGRFEKYQISFWPLMESQVVNIANFCKICVSLFAFVSGYGLYLTWQRAKKGQAKTGHWIWERLVHTLAGYWFVLVLAWIICTLLDNRPYMIYGFEKSIFLGFWNMLIEFLGLTNLVGGKLLDGSWWYISAAVSFVILLPLIDKSFQKLGCFCTLGVVFLFPRMTSGYVSSVYFSMFLPAFCIGAIFAGHDLFAVWDRFWDGWKKTGRHVMKFLTMSGVLVIAYKLYYHLPTKTWWDIKWSLFPLAVILFARDYLFQFTPVEFVLALFGKHSANIWLLHNLIRHYYCESFVYGQGNFLLVISVLFGISLGLSFVIEWLKKFIRYEFLIRRLAPLSNRTEMATVEAE